MQEICECTNNAQCDDGIFCNGAEICTGQGVCGTCADQADPCHGEINGVLCCDEENQMCASKECGSDADCDNGMFCDGVEFCFRRSVWRWA